MTSAPEGEKVVTHRDAESDSASEGFIFPKSDTLVFKGNWVDLIWYSIEPQC